MSTKTSETMVDRFEMILTLRKRFPSDCPILWNRKPIKVIERLYSKYIVTEAQECSIN